MSDAQAEQQARFTGRLRFAAIIAGLVGLLALGSTGIAVWQGNEAGNQVATLAAGRHRSTTVNLPQLRQQTPQTPR